MNKDDFDKAEIIKNLGLLITSGLIERQELAKRLHSIKSELSLVSILISQIEEKDLDKKISSEILEMKELLNHFFHDVRLVNEGIYPKSVYYMGFLKGVQQYLLTLQKEFSINFDLSTTIEHKINLNEIEEVTIYNLCKEILEYLSLAKFGTLNVNFGLEGNTLEIDIIGASKIDAMAYDFVPEQKLDKIKALCFLSNVVYLSETNWYDTFSLNVDLHIL